VRDHTYENKVFVTWFPQVTFIAMCVNAQTNGSGWSRMLTQQSALTKQNIKFEFGRVK